MSTGLPADLSAMSMMELFRLEADAQLQSLTAGLLLLERSRSDANELQRSMRAAHSLKGAARIVGCTAAVTVAHAMEDLLVSAQKGEVSLRTSHIDRLLKGVDLISRIAQTAESDLTKWENAPEVDEFQASLTAIPAEDDSDFAAPAVLEPTPSTEALDTDRVLRVTADHLNRLLGLSGESLVEARSLEPFARSLLRLKRMQEDHGRILASLAESLDGKNLDEHSRTCLSLARIKNAECRELLGTQMAELEMFQHRSAQLSQRLYDEALALRMRPFSDRTKGFPRMVRDLAQALGKEACLEVQGEDTQVDRDILEQLEAPLTHLLRNAIDHGIESIADRGAAGKPRAGHIVLEARHSAGMLLITVRDDGRGVDVEKLRAAVVARQLSTLETAARMTDGELFSFLFLPGFTLRDKVSELSGRGVGLDVVQDTMKRVRGTFRTTSEVGKGTSIQLQLPLTLSVLRALVVEIAGEQYALPLAAIARTLKLDRSAVETLEGRQHFDFDGERAGLVSTHLLMGTSESPLGGDGLSVVVIGGHPSYYGLVVDRFHGEREIVVQPLDSRLGKIKDVSAGALADDGSPLLILDVEDLLRSVERLCATTRLNLTAQPSSAGKNRRKRVLVVDDSLTVRELERKLLETRGYEVDIAIDGMDGWTAARNGDHDLIITDVDMPRLDGIELVSLIRKDPSLKSKPVMIVSYKDRQEDRTRGLEAGADYYLTKGSFHDETLISSVVDLIGEP